MIRRALLLLGVAVIATACTEHLTQPGQCPTYCPGGAATFKDTIITATVGADSSFSGYVQNAELISVLVSNGGGYGETRGILRFFPRGDSIIVKDTSRTFTVDSVQFDISIQARDTSRKNLFIDMYRLPLTVDSTTTQVQLDAVMTPDRLIEATAVLDTLTKGLYHVILRGSDLSKVAFVPSDSTRMLLGFRLRADGPAAVRIGAPAAGSAGPAFTTYATADIADTTLKSQIVTRAGDLAFTARAPGVALDPTLLAVGGYPVARTFLRFNLPTFLRDSATIIRATLELTGNAPVFGIPADTADVVANAVLADFGAKSPISATRVGFSPIITGSTSVSIEVASIVRTWQGTQPLPTIIRLALGSEGASFLAPTYFSSRSATGKPRLRITYRPPFTFAGL
jgi:hypothetical protein